MSARSGAFSPEEGLASSETDALVNESTAAKVRTFLYEIAEGTTNYRSLHSLTQQVEHQYHGRFLVELIQNAHDALAKTEGSGGGRIAIALGDDATPFGALYVANDGNPFSPSNFRSLSQLGQSDKDPQESIGNKGIGFRSVLEICNSPEVYSRSGPDSLAFDGFCFGFYPEVIRKLSEAVMRLCTQGLAAQSPFTTGPLVDWEAALWTKFRASLAQRPSEFLASEIAFLSPYLLPTSIPRHSRSSVITAFEKDDFATVIRLPLKSENSRELARSRIRDLADQTLLFLDRVSTVLLDDGMTKRVVTRKAGRPVAARLDRRNVTIAASAADSEYVIWTRAIRIDGTNPVLLDALSRLPGKWPTLSEARISVAVRRGQTPDTGRFSIFLPTLLESGAACHVSAPFFGDMSRTHIDFSQPYNRGLLEAACSLIVDIVRQDLAGGDKRGAMGIVDLLAPSSADRDAQERWTQFMTAALEQQHVALSEVPWFYADKDEWRSLAVTSLLPTVAAAQVFTPESLREHAQFSVFHSCLSGRTEQLEALADLAHVDAHPSSEDLAATAEAIAASLHQREINDRWNAFWIELQQLIDDPSELIGRRVLLGQDGDLHSSGQDCAVFFVPRQGTGDDEEFTDEYAVADVPQPLRRHVAFLHESIVLHDKGNFRTRTPTHSYLDRTLVNRFRVEDIFSSVLIPRTPPLPVGLNDERAVLCRAILQWGVRLLTNLGGRVRSDRTLRMLRDLPVPCRGGWYRARLASYGPGWKGTLGSQLSRYLANAKGEDCRAAAKRLLMPPNHPAWGDNAAHIKPLLDTAGVGDGLRLDQLEPLQWTSTFAGSGSSFWLTSHAPPRYSRILWEQYRQHANATTVTYYSGAFQYQLQTLFTLPGLMFYEQMADELRVLLMELILGSAAAWPAGWMTLTCKKVTGFSHSITIDSPVAFALKQLKWLGCRSAGAVVWSAPSERWYVPATTLGARGWQFEHLHPLTHAIALRLDTVPEIARILAALGMPHFDLETASESTRLLDALANAAAGEEVRDSNVFLSQVRAAWSVFVPGAYGALPKRLIVERAGHPLEPVVPTAEKRVFVPDSTSSALAALEQFDLPVLAIEPRDAKRLANRLRGAFGNAVVCTSDVDLIPVVDGEAWGGDSGSLLNASEFGWVIPVALTLAAYYGAQARGTEANRFAAQAQAFRQARVQECHSLAVALRVDGRVLAQPECHALWLPEEQTVFVTDACRVDCMLLSEALAHILDRDDLDVPLKYTFRGLEFQPADEAIHVALSGLRITAGQFRQVREHWRGDLRHLIEMLAPLAALLRSTEDLAALLAADSEESLMRQLSLWKLHPLDPTATLTRARAAADAFEFGRECFRLFGSDLQLNYWNSVLRKFKTRELRNGAAASEFEVHALEAKQRLRCLLVGGLSRSQVGRPIRQYLSDLDAVKCPPAFASTLWEVAFADALSAYAPVLKETGVSAHLIDLLANCHSSRELAQRLRTYGIDVETDPVERARRNGERLRAAASQLQEIGLAWALGRADAAAVLLWESRIDGFMESLTDLLESDAYFSLWSDEEVFRRLRRVRQDESSHLFWSVFAVCPTFPELRARLGLDEMSVRGAASRLSELKSRATQRQRLVSVCGRNFENTPLNLGALWAHIRLAIPDESVAGLSAIDLTRPANLASTPKSKVRAGGDSAGGGGARHSRDTDELVGLAGEIHGFRRLQAQFGIVAVTPTSWISSNGRIVYPGNTEVEDDAAGCDFKFAVDGRTYHVEVKASSGEDEYFTLGSSEIRLAMSLARGGRKQRGVFVVLRVLNALSSRPEFLLLPNPYDSRYQTMYDIVEAGARVKYRIVPTPEAESDE